MSRTFIQPGDILALTAPSGGVTAGLAYLIGSLVVIALDTQAVGVTFQGRATGVHLLAKATGQAWTEGVKVYWDDTAKKFTTTSTSNTLVGVATAAAASGDATGYVRLDGVAR